MQIISRQGFEISTFNLTRHSGKPLCNYLYNEMGKTSSENQSVVL